MTKNPELSVEEGSKIDHRWVVKKILGSGAFGAVYEVSDRKDADKLYALKLETKSDDAGAPPRMLPLEVTVLRALRAAKAQHTPAYVSCGVTTKFNYVVMGLVGQNLSALKKAIPEKRFRLHTVLHIGSEILKCLLELHDVGYIHRDIKPQNICIGRGADSSSVYLIDWGMCRQFRNPDTGQLHRPRIRAPFRGTPRYASVNALSDKDQSMIDDLWSWFTVLIDLTVGKLPWDGARGPRDQNEFLQWLAERKARFVPDVKLFCRGCPREYTQMHAILGTYTYYDKPNYELFSTLLKEVVTRKQLVEGSPLDWQPGARSRAPISESKTQRKSQSKDINRSNILQHGETAAPSKKSSVKLASS